MLFWVSSNKWLTTRVWVSYKCLNHIIPSDFIYTVVRNSILGFTTIMVHNSCLDLIQISGSHDSIGFHLYYGSHKSDITESWQIIVTQYVANIMFQMAEDFIRISYEHIFRHNVTISICTIICPSFNSHLHFDILKLQPQSIMPSFPTLHL